MGFPPPGVHHLGSAAGLLTGTLSLRPVDNQSPARPLCWAKSQALVEKAARPELSVMNGRELDGQKDRRGYSHEDTVMSQLSLSLSLSVLNQTLSPFTCPDTAEFLQHFVWHSNWWRSVEKSYWRHDENNVNSNNNCLYLSSPCYGQDLWWVLYIIFQFIFAVIQWGEDLNRFTYGWQN